jgi:hypothetical protein
MGVDRWTIINWCQDNKWPMAVFLKNKSLWPFSLSNLKLFEGGCSCHESVTYNQ